MSQFGTANGGGVFPPGSVVQTLQGNSGGAVGPNASNNIFVEGDGITITAVGNPGTNTITFSTLGSVVLQFNEDSGTANPSGGIIHMSGGTNMNSVGAGSVVTYNLDDAIVLATSVSSPLYLAPSGNINLQMNDAIGTTSVSFLNSSSVSVGSVTSSGVANFTLSVGTGNLKLMGNTISSTNPNGDIIISPNGLGKVDIAYAIQNGVPYFGASGALLSTAALTNGQLVIGNTGNPPSVSTLTAGTGISITNGAGSITISSSGSTTLNYTSVNHAASPYTVLLTDDFIGADVTAGVITIRLPNAPATGTVFVIKDIAGLAATSNITVTTVGGAVTIDGATSQVMNTNYESISVLFNGTSYLIY